MNYLKIYGSEKIRHKIFVPSNSHPLKAQSTKSLCTRVRESEQRRSKFELEDNLLFVFTIYYSWLKASSWDKICITLPFFVYVYHNIVRGFQDFSLSQWWTWGLKGHLLAAFLVLNFLSLCLAPSCSFTIATHITLCSKRKQEKKIPKCAFSQPILDVSIAL